MDTLATFDPDDDLGARVSPEDVAVALGAEIEEVLDSDREVDEFGQPVLTEEEWAALAKAAITLDVAGPS
jgi:imidazoleglycerol phosphate dehydratase HisB